MTPDASTWRTAAEYDHLDTLAASDLAWEWLRRNDAYDADYTALAGDLARGETLSDRIRRWGLRFPRRSPNSAT